MRAIALPHAHSAHPARARPAAAAKGVPAIQTSQITSSYAGARLAAGRRGGSARTLAGFAVRAKAAGDDEDSCAFGAFSGFKLLGVPHMTDSFPDMETFPNPLAENDAFKGVRQYFIDGGSVVLKDIVANINEPSEPTMFLRAGPKKDIFYNPDETRAAIVTCGGLCPGLNTVVREIVCTLWFQYGVRDILGVEGGYKGFYSSNMKQLDPKVVDAIHKQGGTFLGTSRGGSDIGKICDAIVARGINQVYIIGGDGTMRGAHAIHQELSARKAEVAVIGVPKTIDNDIDLIDKSFGFDTAVEEAQRAINAAHVEATSTENGIGIVKLMGRHAGFIAMYATLASRDVDLCLIPEVPFFMEGRSGLVEFVCKRLRRDGHIVIVVAEGAGQHYVSEFSHLKGGADASGNKLLADIGLWLKDQVKTEVGARGFENFSIKYIDPTYMIRAVPSNGSDNVYCNLLSQSAVHGAMAGYTGFMAGPINGRHALIPMDNVVTRTVNIYDRMWARLLASTGQPAFSAQQLLQARAAGGSVDSNDMATEGARRPAANPAAMAGGRGAVHDPEVQKAIPEDLKKPDSTPHDEAEKAKGGAKTGTA